MYESMVCEIIVIIVILFALGRKNKTVSGAKQPETFLKSYRIYELFVFLGVTLLIISRIYKFGQIPGGINQDEAMAAVDAYALANYGTDRFGMSYPVHFTAWGYGQMSVLLSYLMIPFMKIWGLSVITARLPMLITSIAGALFLFLLIKQVVGNRAGLIALFLVTINPWHFMQSRWSLDCNIFPHLFIAGLFFLNKGIRKTRYLYISMFLFAVSMYSYGVSFYMVPFFLVAVCIILNIKKKITIGKSITLAATYLLFSWPIYLTMFINFIGGKTIHFFKLTIPFFEDSIRSGDIIFFSDDPWQQLKSNLHSLIHVVFVQGGDYLWNALDNFGTLYWCTIPFVLVGLVVCILRIKTKEKVRYSYIFFLLYWCFALLLGVFIANVNVNRINIVFYAQLILAAIGIDYILEKRKTMLVPIFAIYVYMTILFSKQYFQVYAREIEGVFFADFIQAIEDAQDYESDRYYIALASEYDEAANCAEILTLYAQKMDSQYFQGKTDKFIGHEIAYKERYYYRIPSDEEISQDIDTVYVLRNNQRERFDENEYTIKEYGEFLLIY